MLAAVGRTGSALRAHLILAPAAEAGVRYIGMAKTSQIVLWGTAAVCVVLLAGCGDDVTVAYPSSTPVELFRRVHQFLTVSIVLLNEGKTLWGQAISNAYYAALTLARFKSNSFYGDATEAFHQQVWAQAPKLARKYFRDELRRLRVKYDYHFDWPSDEGPADDLAEFAAKAPPAFTALFDDTEAVIAKRYRQCADENGEKRETCSLCDKRACGRKMLLAELAIARGKVDELCGVAIPAVLAAPVLETRDPPIDPSTPST